KQQIDDAPLGSADRPRITAQIQQLAEQVSTATTSAMAAARSDAERSSLRSMLAGTSIIAADVARRELKDPQRALKLLENLESTVQGLSNSEQLVNEAMYIRVQSYMASERYTDATQELVKLLSKTEGAHGAQIVYNLLEKLNADFERAQSAGDQAAM